MRGLSLFLCFLLLRYYINSEGLLITEQQGTVAKTFPKDYCFDAVRPKRTTVSQLDANDGENSSVTDQRDSKNALIFSRQVALVCFEPLALNKKEKDFVSAFRLCMMFLLFSVSI